MTTGTSAGPWRPLLAGAAAERAWQVVDEIAGALAAWAELPAEPPLPTMSRPPFSLASGLAGVALFFAYLDRGRPGRGHDALAAELLDRAIDGIGSSHGLPGIYSGFPGVALVTEHLQGRLLDGAAGDPGEEAAAALAGHLARAPWRGDYDLIEGLVGYAVYALERMPRRWGRECLEAALARLGELAEEGPEGIAWNTPVERLRDEGAELYPHGHYNLGLAHGAPGVIALLGRLRTLGLGGRDSRRLLDGAVRWLLARKLPPGEPSVFPATVAPDRRPPATRVAWCYGDLGVAVALMAAARGAGEAAWEAEALALARAVAARPRERSGVVDASLCHGSAGALHLFNRLAQAARDPALAAAARDWFEHTLSLRRPGEGLAGFLAWDVPARGGVISWQAEPGFLTGAAGVGLALLAAATPIEPEWDHVLLASVPPGPPASQGCRRSISQPPPATRR